AAQAVAGGHGGGGPTSITIADFNSDGRLDLATADFSNNQPRPKDVVLGGPPRGGRFRVVAPVGGVGVGKAPSGPLVVTRGPTLLDDSPAPPAPGYTAAPGLHPPQQC